MTWLSLKQIAAMTQGRLYGSDADIDSVCIDSRQISQDQLFIAIKGEHFDAHDFVADLSGKAAAALVHQKMDCDLPPNCGERYPTCTRRTGSGMAKNLITACDCTDRQQR